MQVNSFIDTIGDYGAVLKGEITPGMEPRPGRPIRPCKVPLVRYVGQRALYRTFFLAGSSRLGI